jgi:hypothetical protein
MQQPTPVTDHPAATIPPPAPSNLLKNGNFNEPGGSPTLLVTNNPPWGYLPTAAPHWDVWNNHAGPTTTALLPSTMRGLGAGMMLQVCTVAIDSGLRQWFSPDVDTGPAKTKSAAWVYVLSGKVGIGTGNVGATGDHDRVSTKIGEWEYLEAPNGVSPANMFIVYATEFGGACFFIDNASVYAA